MKRKNLPIMTFQTFFVSREMSNCPLIVDMMRVCKKLDKLNLLGDGDGSISVAYGKRIILNGNDGNLKHMKQEDIVEIVDYDPIKNIVLALGIADPCSETPVHWLIQKARDDIHAVLLLSNKKIVKKLPQDVPATEHEAPSGTIDLAKEVLKALRQEKTIAIKNKGVLFAGFNLKEIEDSVVTTFSEV
jgi:ribulose-5-phosphate 4-epimerase/fuculose-1-phosphate aldolase